MRGIEFVLNSFNFGVQINELFNEIYLMDHDIYILDATIYDESMNRVACPDHAKFPFFQNTKYYIQHMVLAIFPNNSTIENITTYEDFINSHCELLLLIYDVAYGEIYVKSKDWLFKLLDNIEKMKVKELCIKTDESDMRTAMYV